MRCPWCAKRIDYMKRIDRDPAQPVASIEGAMFLCQGCKKLSVLIAGGRALRKPTASETIDLAPAQAAADQIVEGTITLAEVERAALAFRKAREN